MTDRWGRGGWDLAGVKRRREVVRHTLTDPLANGSLKHCHLTPCVHITVTHTAHPCVVCVCLCAHICAHMKVIKRRSSVVFMGRSLRERYLWKWRCFYTEATTHTLSFWMPKHNLPVSVHSNHSPVLSHHLLQKVFKFGA